MQPTRHAGVAAGTVALFLLLGAAGRPAAAQEEFPLAEGNTWVYSTDLGQDMIIRVIGTEEVRGVSCAVLSTALAGQENREWVGLRKDGLRLYRMARGTGDMVLKKSVLRLKLPLAAGATWTSVIEEGGFSVTTEYAVAGPEAVDAAGRTWQAMKVTGTIRGPAGEQVSECWFAPGVGMVKQVFRATGHTNTAVLKSHTIVKGPAQTGAAPPAGKAPAGPPAVAPGQTPTPAPAAAAAAPPDGAPVCTQCGRPGAPGQKFCPECGGKLAAPPPARPAACTGCGTRFVGDEKFCPECGAPRGDGAPAPAPTPADAPGAGNARRAAPTPVPAALPAAPPAGYELARPASGSGIILIRHIPQAASARALAEAGLRDLATWLDGAPATGGAFVRVDGKGAQAPFEIAVGGRPYRGLLLAELAGDEGQILLLLDEAARFADSLPRLAQEVARRAPAPAGPEALAAAVRGVTLTEAQVPGIATLRLPAGWRVKNATPTGMISAEGPEGVAEFGCFLSVYTPEAAAMLPLRPPFVASYGDPGRALGELYPQFSASLEQQGLPGARLIRVVEQAPAEAPNNGVAAWVHYEYEATAAAGGGAAERWTALAWIAQLPNGDGTYTFYTSYVAALTPRFGRALPALLATWIGWKTDEKLLAERLAAAVKSLTACSEIVQEVTLGRAQATDKALAAWDIYIRGGGDVENPETGERKWLANDEMDKALEELNRQAGGNIWKKAE
ncbi:MAG: zinc ribbon domain-containing protein [Planctomycetes bacterium]|nr:zinc ribbon domain-containing protein [Planctomycetota bacterium]